ncbi:MAG TPA: hypothetical protein DCZ30_07655 [Clostridiales bacterium]|nr:hypothetical protein [Clostridiales bacterium]
MKEIEKLEKKIKYNPFWKNKNRILLAEKMDELEKIQKASSQADEFESLTPEDKKEIIEYLLSKDRLNNLEKQLSNNKKERSKYRFPKIENERCTRTWSKMLNKGEISDENLDEVFKKLDKVGLETERTECGFNIWVQEPDDADIRHCRTFPDFLKMIQNVYQNARARGRIDSSIKNIAFSQTTSSIKNGIGEIREGVEELETPTRDEDSSISLDD